MEHSDRASLMAAPPTPDLDLNFAGHTAVEASRALWRAALPPPNARVSVSNTVAVVEVNAGLPNAQPYQSASSSSATSMAGLASAHTHQDAARLQPKQIAIAEGIPSSKFLFI